MVAMINIILLIYVSHGPSIFGAQDLEHLEFTESNKRDVITTRRREFFAPKSFFFF